MAEDLAELTPAQKIRLLQIAREAIYYHVTRNQAPRVQEEDERLDSREGVFVSLHLEQTLRGCIGTFSGDGPLHQTVTDMAVSAATRDPRFPPIRADEIPTIDIELSILGPLKPAVPKDVVVGQHGLLISSERMRGTLLPQVATQYGWSREEFLSQTCIKGGLERNAWKGDNCVIQIFRADVFGETEMRPDD